MTVCLRGPETVKKKTPQCYKRFVSVLHRGEMQSESQHFHDRLKLFQESSFFVAPFLRSRGKMTGVLHLILPRMLSSGCR